MEIDHNDEDNEGVTEINGARHSEDGKTLRITQLLNLTFFVLMTLFGDKMIS